jgi:hypothetical protein
MAQTTFVGNGDAWNTLTSLRNRKRIAAIVGVSRAQQADQPHTEPDGLINS